MKLAVLFLALALTGCTGLDNYDRSYSLQYGDGKQTLNAGVTLHPRSPVPVRQAQFPTAADTAP